MDETQKPPDPSLEVQALHQHLAQAREQVRKRELEIVAWENLSRAVFNQAQEALVVCDHRNRIIRASQAAHRLAGKNPLGLFFQEAFPLEMKISGKRWRDDYQPGGFSLADALVGGEFQAAEAILCREDGQVFQLRVTAGPFQDGGGSPQECLVTMVDLTAQKQAEEILRQADEKVNALLQASPLPIVSLDFDGRVKVWNRAAEKLFGWSQDEVLGQAIPTIPPERQGELKELLHRERSGEPLAGIETQRVTRDGRLVEVSLHTGLIRDGKGEVTGAIALMEDISARKQTEKVLSESEKLYRALFDNMLNGFAYCRMLYDKDRPLDFIYLKVNKAFEELTGLQGVVGKKASEVIPGIQESDPSLIEIYGKVASTGKPERFETYVQALQMWFSISAYSPNKDYFVAIFDIITARKEAEEALRTSEAREHARAVELQALFDAVPAYVFLSQDDECRNMTGNALSYELLGIPPGENLSKSAPEDERLSNFRILNNGLEIAPEELPVQRAAKGEQVRDYEFDLIYSDGAKRSLLGNAVPLLDDAGSPRGAVSAFIDITERKQAEEALKRQHAILEGINRIFREALSCATEEEWGKVCLAVAEELTESTLGFISEINPLGRLDDIAISDSGRTACNLPDSNKLILNRNLHIHGIYGRCLKDGQSVIANDPAAHPDRIGTPPGHPALTAFLGVPLKHQGQTVGMVGLGNKAGGYSLDDQETVEALAVANVEALRHFRSEKKAASLNRLYRLLSRVNETIMRAPDQDRLFAEVCRVAVEEGRFLTVWIGLKDEAEQLVRPVALSGVEQDYLKQITISIQDEPEGRGPTGTAIREGRYDFCNDILNDPRMAPWRDKALEVGYRSSAAFPLKVDQEVIGAVAFYAGEPHFFTSEEVGLLVSLADNLSFALESMDREAKRRRAREALKTSEQNLRLLTSRLLTAQENERRRIALELHDDLGQALVILKLKMRGVWQGPCPQTIIKLRKNGSRPWNPSITSWKPCAASLGNCGRQSWMIWACLRP